MASITIKPVPGESLISFMIRFAQENGTDFLTLWNYVRSSKISNPQKADAHLIEITPGTMMNMDKLSFETEMSFGHIVQMTFQPVLQRWSDDSLTHRSRILKGMIRENMHYCTLCFTQKPHVKLKWKIQGIDYCPEHGLPLLSNCTHCGNQIEMKEIRFIGECPSCHKELQHCHQPAHNLSNEWIDEQLRLQHIWDELLSYQGETLKSSDIAIKMLYLLNNKNDVFDLSVVAQNCEELGLKRASLMQVARDTWAQKRSVHIQTILKVLITYKHDLLVFMQMNVPAAFQVSVNPHADSLIETSCLSPWCTSFQQPGSLVKTGTKIKRYKNGSTLRNHLACLECGCHYAFDEQNKIITKDPFLNGYKTLIDLDYRETINSPKELSKLTGDSEAYWKRILAYFNSRAIFNDPIQIDQQILDRFVHAISHSTMNKIEKWHCWANRDHFLLYRYHPNVMKAHILHKKKLPERLNRDQCWKRIVSLCDEWLLAEKDITLGTISTEVGVSENTLRKWGFHIYIKNMTAQQRKSRTNKMKEKLYKKVDQYLEEHAGNRVHALNIYKNIGVRQSYLCKVAPDVNQYITEQRAQYNSCE